MRHFPFLVLPLLLALLVPVISSAQVVKGEIKCAAKNNDGTQYDIHLQPDSKGQMHFKRCDPGYDSGLGCVVYADTVCNVTVLKLKLGLQLNGSCKWTDVDGVSYTYSFMPWDSDPLQHSITVSTSKAPAAQFYGTDYYCQKLK